MLVQPPIEELLPKAESRYTLAMLVAKRTRQLVDGAQPMVAETTPNLVTLACEEIVAGKVVGIQGIHNPTVPLRPEIEEARRLAKELAESQAALDAFPDLIDMRVLNAVPDEVEEEDAIEDGIALDEITDEVISDDIADVNDEDIKDLISLDGAETEDAE